MTRWPALMLCVLAAAVLTAGRTAVQAHKTVVSKYTFNRDVRPILERRCVQCHATGSALPLHTYADVKTQSWPLRQTLIAGRMPPYYAEPGEVALKDPQTLSPRELDVLMTWASGGTPEGTPGPAGVTRQNRVQAPDSTDVAQAQSLTMTAGGIQLERSIRIAAVRSTGGMPGTRVRVVAVGADGSRRHLVDLRVEPAWPRRYDFVHAIAIPAGSRIEVAINPASELWRSLVGGPTAPPAITEFTLELELIR
jgi:hypothetical protein